MGGYVGIPTSYTPVEYIESTSTQYIDTGLKTNGVSKIQATASNTFGLTYSDIPYGNSLFGARVSATDSNFQYANGAYNEFVGNGTSQLSLTRNTSTNDLTVEISKTSYSVTSQNYNTSGSLSVSISTPLNIYLFGLNNNGTFSGGTWKIYTFKMYDNSNNLIRDFIPVLDENNIACLYELVEGKFYYNKGTGTFTAGAAGEPISIGGRARKITKAYVGVPASYTPVEYIESSGTQYIDTGFLPNSNTSVILEAKIPSSRSSNITRFFESRNEASSVTGAFGVISFNDNNKLLQIRYDASTSLSNAQLSIDVKHKISMQKNQLYIDDVLKITASTATFQTNYSLLIFGFHTPSAKQNGEGVYLLYSFKIYDNGTLVRDYIPVIDQDNVACLYEQVEGKLYYNEGTGSFTAGSTTGSPVSIGSVAREIKKGYVGVPVSYTPVEYIESTGTQYIDTGVYPSSSSKVELDYQLTGTTTSFATTNILRASNGADIPSFSCGCAGGGGNANNARFCFGSNYSYYVDFTGLNNTNRHTVKVDCVNSNVVVDSASTYNVTRSTFTCTSTMSLPAQGAVLKIYSCKIYEYDVLVRDFIPVVNQDNVACLYEQVEGRLYYNKGTGTFSAGSAIGQEVALNPVARLCYSASALPDTALFLCHLDNNTTNEITGNNTAPYSTSVTSYSAGKFGQAATIRATEVAHDYAASTSIFSLSDTNLPNAYNVLNGNASPVTATGWFKSNTNDGWIFAYGYGDFKTWGSGGAASYRNGIGVDASGGYLRAKIVYRTSSTPLNTASVTTDVASSVYADGNWHHYAIEVSSTGMNFYFDGVYKCHINKPSNIMSDGFANRVHFSLGDEIMVCGELLYNQRNFTPPDKPYTI